MGEPYCTKKLSGWGRIRPRECRAYRPERRRDVAAILEEDTPHYIAQGLGRSYGDPAVNEGGGVVGFERLNRMLDFNADTGVLHCEAGVSLAEVLECFLPRGWFLPVTPGTKFVTVGGAIANDVHGKNHHADGTFGRFVEELTLLTPGGDTLACSPQDNEDIFWATVGGIGLTGFILTARVRLIRVPTAYVTVDYHKSPNLDDALATMAESDARYKYSVAWIDCLARGKDLGRAVLMRGNHARAQDLSLFQREHPLRVPGKRAKSVPCDFPRFVLNSASVKAFNTLFYTHHYTRPGALVDYDSYFYPLDGIHNWNRMYGKTGFVQYQATFPEDEVRGVVRTLEALSQSRRPSFLAVLKRFGDANPGLLSYPFRGYTLSLDIANRSGLPAFLKQLDAILLDHGGRLYLAKDALTDAGTFRAMYPRTGEFLGVKERLDPQGVLSSSMARRLGLAQEPGGGP